MKRLHDLWEGFLKSIFQMDKWAFIIGVLAGCCIGAIIYACFKLPFTLLLEVLNSNAFGAFLGAVITGFTAIGIQIYEKDKNEKQRKEDSIKIKFQLHFLSTDLVRNKKIIEENFSEISSMFNPHDQIVILEDDDGNVIHIDSPPDDVLENYNIEVKPYQVKIKNAMDNMANDFVKIALINIEKLDPQTLREVEKFKYKSSQIEKIIFDAYPKKRGILNTKNLDTIKKTIDDFVSIIK